MCHRNGYPDIQGYPDIRISRVIRGYPDIRISRVIRSGYPGLTRVKNQPWITLDNPGYFIYSELVELSG